MHESQNLRRVGALYQDGGTCASEVYNCPGPPDRTCPALMTTAQGENGEGRSSQDPLSRIKKLRSLSEVT